ncbi:MAG: CHASE domain-containing protein [Phycisphaerae bacterium]
MGPYFVGALTLFAGLVITASAFVWVRNWESVRISADFQRDAASMIVSLRTELRSHLETLHFLREFYARVPRVERADFETFVSGALRRHHGFQAIEWIPRVPAGQREAFERAVRADGFPDFRIHPPTNRDECFPVNFVVPFAGNEKAHGYDVASQPQRLAALETARASGEMTATAPIRLIQEAGEQAGFLAFMPIYAGGEFPATVEQRRERLAGFVLGVFRAGDLIDGSVQGLDTEGIAYSVDDVTDPQQAAAIYRHPAEVAGTEAAATAGEPGALRFDDTLEVAGRRWMLVCQPIAGHAAFRVSRLPYVVLAGGALFSFLLAGYLRAIVGRSARTARDVRERTAELSATNAQLKKEARERQLADELLQRNLARQVRLNRLLQDDLPRAPELEDKLQRITDAIAEIFHTDLCRIWFIAAGDRCDSGCVHGSAVDGRQVCQRRDRCLHLVANAGHGAHADRGMQDRVPFGQCRIGKVAATEEAKFLTNDLQHDPCMPKQGWASDLGLMSFAGYRLCAADGESIGVLAVFSQRALAPDEDSLLEAMATHASHIIQASRAEDELKRARDGLESRVEQRTADLAQANRALAKEIESHSRAEEALRESETKYRQLFESLNDAAFLADVETGRILETNRCGEELLGRTRDEIIGMHQRDLHPPELAADYEVTFASHFAQGKVVDYDGEIGRADGTVVPVRISAAPLTLNGRPALLGLFHNIAEQKRADETALAFSRQQSVVDALLRMGLEDTPLDEVLEHCLSEIVFNTWMDLVPQGAIYLVEDEPGVLVLRARAAAGPTETAWHRRIPAGQGLCGEAVTSGETQFSDGTEASDTTGAISSEEPPPHGHYCVPLRSMQGPLGMLVLGTPPGYERSVVQEDCLDAVSVTIGDIIQRKRMEEKLRESEARHRAITEAAQDAIITADANGRIRFWNPAAERIFGFTADEIVGQPVIEALVSPQAREDRRRDLDRRAREGASPGRTLEFNGLRKDGAEFPMQVSLSGYTDHEGPVTVALVKDITDRKRAEVELETANRELQDASRRAGMAEVASGVLHNVGNVLNTANVSAQLATDRARQLQVAKLTRVVPLLEEQAAADEASPAAAKNRQIALYLRQLAEHLTDEQANMLQELGALQGSIRHVADIVSMQQTYARDSGVVETFSVNSVIRDALRMSATSFEQLGIAVVVQCPERLKLTTDRQKLLQILVNLIRNANHALQERDEPGRQLTVAATQTDGGRVRTAVIDNGVGIAPEHVARLFAFGFTTKKDGHGFGLHSSALAVKAMGGSLTAHSDGRGHGATFTLELPAEPERTDDANGD